MVWHEQMGPHFAKVHINPNNELDWPIQPVVHDLRGPDYGDPHDHPWSFTTHIIYGGYIEEVFIPLPSGGVAVETVERLEGQSYTIEASHIHRIVSLLKERCFTISIYGKPERDVSFYRFNDGQRLKRFHNCSHWEQF